MRYDPSVPPKRSLLDALVHVRERRADDAKQRFAAAIQEREAEERRREATEASRDGTRAAHDAVRQTEREALARGDLSAEDLARAHAWEVRAREEQTQADRRVEQAKEREGAARSKEGQARSELSERSAERDVVDTHRGRLEARERAVADAKDEELAAEAWRPGRH
jgi:hypothetical protein